MCLRIGRDRLLDAANPPNGGEKACASATESIEEQEYDTTEPSIAFDGE